METLNLNEILKGFNLTSTEILVFTELNKLGTAQIGKIIKYTSLHRGTVYNTLQRLKERGLILLVKKDKLTNYGVNPNSFLSMIEEEKLNLERKEELAKKIIEHMKLSKVFNYVEKPSVYCLEGEMAFRGLFMEILQSNSKNEENYLFCGNGGEMRDYLGSSYYRKSQIMKVFLGTKCKIILNTDKETHPFAKEVRGTIKWLPKDNDFASVNTWIYGEKTIIVDWQSKPLNIIVIENENIANHYKQIWKSLWKHDAIKQQEVYDLNL